MNDFNKLKNRCDEASRIAATLIDEFILHYAAAKDNLAREFDLRIWPYKHVTQTDTVWVNMLKSQYIIHRVFRSGGLLAKYLTHIEIKQRSQEEQNFLNGQLPVPWRFCFSRIVSNPSPDFYEMEDVFSDTSFLLYSKSTTQILKEQPAMLWFNLVHFNGSCWQTYGPVNAYQSFDPDDIFFFGTELNPQIDGDESLLHDVGKNPIPYMMLFHGARIPVTVNKDDELLVLFSEYELRSIDLGELEERFKVEYDKNVCRITVKHFAGPPHLAAAYFDESKNRLVITSMTERGFNGLVENLNRYGFDISAEPQIRIHPSMLATAEHILKKQLILNPYEKRFSPESTPEQKAELEKMNQFLKSVLPAINDGAVIDIEALARKAGVDETLAKKFFDHTQARVELLRKLKG